MIKDDFKYYIANQDEIIKDHINDYVVIKNAAVIGYFKEEMDAFRAMKDHELGTYIVKKCQNPGTDTITYYNNRVSFA